MSEEQKLQAQAALEKVMKYKFSNFDAGAVIHWAEREFYQLKDGNRDKDAEIENLKAELAATYEELIDHTGDDMIDTRARRVAALKGDAS